MAAGYSWDATDATSMVLRCFETSVNANTHLAYIVRIVSGDGTTERGLAGGFHQTSSEFPTTFYTRIHANRTAGAETFTSLAGDRIIIEMGLHGVTPAAEEIQMRIGDPIGTNDFALTAGLTTDLCPWVRLSRDVTFMYDADDCYTDTNLFMGI